MFLLIGVLFIGEIFIHAQKKAWKEFIKSTALLIVSMLIILGTKLSWLEMNRNYLKETMRGGHSELVSDEGNDEKLSFSRNGSDAGEAGASRAGLSRPE